MNKNVGSFLAVMLLLSVFVSCSKHTNYATDEPFIVLKSSPAGPDHIKNFYPRYLGIYDDGRLVLYSEETDDIKMGVDAPTFEKKITDEEVEKVKEAIEKNKFWRLKENLSDDNSVDGGFSYVTVNLTDKTKRVGGLNPQNKRFSEIKKYVYSLLDDGEYRRWIEDIEAHILQMNPEFAE